MKHRAAAWAAVCAACLSTGNAQDEAPTPTPTPTPTATATATSSAAPETAAGKPPRNTAAEAVAEFKAGKRIKLEISHVSRVETSTNDVALVELFTYNSEENAGGGSAFLRMPIGEYAKFSEEYGAQLRFAHVPRARGHHAPAGRESRKRKGDEVAVTVPPPVATKEISVTLLEIDDQKRLIVAK